MTNSNLVEPIHVGQVNGQPVRFFASHLDRPDWPHHAIDDLHKALGMPRELRRKLVRVAHKAFGQWMRTVAIEGDGGGLVTLAPNQSAQVVFENLNSLGYPNPELFDEFADAACEAANVVTAAMPPEVAVRYMAAATLCVPLDQVGPQNVIQVPPDGEPPGGGAA